MENPHCNDTICRTCMSKGQNLQSILEYEGVSKLRISEILMTTVPQLHIQPGADKLPVLICGVCLNKLTIAYHYQQLCIQTDKRLKAMLVQDGGDADENQMDVEKKLIDVCFLNEIVTDPLVPNNATALPLQDTSIKIENEPECRAFIDDHEEDADSPFKSAALDTASAKDGDGDGEDEDVDDAQEYLEHYSDADCNEDIDEADVDIKPAEPRRKGTTARISSHHNETGVDEIEKPDIRNRRSGHYPCPHCLKDFDRPYRLRRHIVVHSNKRLHECDICKYRFSTENHLKRHKSTHNSDDAPKKATPPDGYKCAECPRRFEKRESLSAHLQSHRRANPQQSFQCEYCPKKFVKFTLLTKHSRTHPENQKFKCHLCEKTFGLNAHLIEHLQKHSGIKKFVCIHCDKAFQQNGTLKEHIRTHTGETPHLCPECGKSFKNGSNMRQHLLRHSDEKRYRCQECPSKFACQSDQIKHMSVHRKCNAHICDICGSSFSRSYTLKKHKQIHSGKRPYKCEECNMSFVFIDHMRRHIRTHTGHKPHKCKYCDRAYAESGDLNKHLRSHVGENTYMCDECPKAFKYKKELQLHIIQHFKQSQFETKTEIVSTAESEVSSTKATTPTATVMETATTVSSEALD